MLLLGQDFTVMHEKQPLVFYPFAYLMGIENFEFHRFSEILSKKYLYGEYQLAWSVYQMGLRRQYGHPKCNCNLDSDWLSHRSETILISMIPARVASYVSSGLTQLKQPL